MIEIRHLRFQNHRFVERRADTRLEREFIFTQVLVKQRRPVIPEEEKIVVAVVRKIGKHCAAHSPLGRVKSGGGGGVRKRSVAIVA